VLKVILTLTQAGAEKVIAFIEDQYEFFPEELEGPLAPRTFRACPKFWLRAFEIPTPYDRSTGIPLHFIEDALAQHPNTPTEASLSILTGKPAWRGPIESF
jgi:hypothetical protein